MPFLTPDKKPGTLARLLLVNRELMPIANGAINLLTLEKQWKEFGEMTATECAEAFAGVTYLMQVGCIFPSFGMSDIINAHPCNGSVLDAIEFPELAQACEYLTSGNDIILPEIPGHVIIVR